MDRRRIFKYHAEARRAQRVLGALAICTLLAGCHGGPSPEFPDWVGHLNSESSNGRSSNGFSDYVRAAEEAEKQGGKYLDAVAFYPGQRKAAMEKTSRALSLLISGTSRKCEFEFVPSGPFKTPLYQRGWRLLGRDLVWKVQAAIDAQNYAEAVRNANLAMKFGFDISGGDAIDASLGLSIVNEARQAIAPALKHMDSTQLSNLAAGVTRALENKPSLKTTIDHERLNMLMGVQAVQDAYRANNFDAITKDLGVDMRNAISHLENLRRNDHKDRPAYFAGFAAEAEAETRWMEQQADEAVALRSGKPPTTEKGERPWRKFSKHFFTSLEPLLEIHDKTLARTRLLLLEASIREQVRSSGRAPKDLSGFNLVLRTDPYSGKDFVYGADGSDYHVYSVGDDLKDDGGETDETYSQPDLKLEKGD